MPKVMNKDILAKAYLAASRKIEQNQIPTQLLEGERTVFRSFNPTKPHSYLQEPAAWRGRLQNAYASAAHPRGRLERLRQQI